MTNQREYLAAGRTINTDSGLHKLVGVERVVARSKARILLVDDSPDYLDLGEQYLRELGFSHIYRAENGEEALNLAREHQPHATILDTSMPGRNGYEICLDLRKTYGPKMLIMGNSDNPDNESRWNESGVDGFVDKGNIIGEPRADCPYVAKLDIYFPINPLSRKIE